jgi:hypothetical protein
VYHPQKCIGLGHTDGEGCERVWAGLQKLIPGTRVSGVRLIDFLYNATLTDRDTAQHHQRLYAIDQQLGHMSEEGFKLSGLWWCRKKKRMMEKLAVARSDLQKCGLDAGILRAEWTQQVQDMGKKAPGVLSIPDDLLSAG